MGVSIVHAIGLKELTNEVLSWMLRDLSAQRGGGVADLEDLAKVLRQPASRLAAAKNLPSAEVLPHLEIWLEGFASAGNRRPTIYPLNAGERVASLSCWVVVLPPKVVHSNRR